MTETDNRRPLKSRSAPWAGALAARLAAAGAQPDAISALSVAFAALGAALLLWTGALEGGWRAAAFVLAAVCVQLRLLCNLLDGMVAVEHGRGSPDGPIWNELPDRAADVLLLVGAGYGAAASGLDAGRALGWLAAVLAVTTAYVRELGRGLGLTADFAGPLAKPQRMAVLTATCLVAAVEPLWGWRGECVLIGLGMIALGTALTVARRTRRLSARLRERAAGG